MDPSDELQVSNEPSPSMSERIWDELKDTSLKPSLHLRGLLSSDSNRAVFQGNYLEALVRGHDRRWLTHCDGILVNL